MKVSVIIPVYNVENYIERCILSVIGQTYPDIECIIVDDCTPDNSIGILKKLLCEYNGHITFQILKHEKNRGLSAARNTGTEKATGDYIYYLDSDDELTPDCISHLAEIASSDDSIEIVQGNTKRYPEEADTCDGYDISRYNLPKAFTDNESIRNWFYDINSPRPINAWNKLIKRDFCQKHKLYFEEGLIHEDELWMFYVTKALKHIRFTHEITYKHYCTPNSIITSSSQQKSACHIGRMLKIATADFDEAYFTKQYQFYLCYFAPRFIAFPRLGDYPHLYKWFIRQSMEKRMYYYTFVLVIAKCLSFSHRGKNLIQKLIKSHTL